MFLTLKKDWWATDANDNEDKDVTVPAGRHEVERIPNPRGYDDDWLVLKGTKIGAAETFWREHQDAPDELKVIIEE